MCGLQNVFRVRIDFAAVGFPNMETLQLENILLCSRHPRNLGERKDKSPISLVERHTRKRTVTEHSY